MNSRVVNVRVKYIRPRYHDLKEWCRDPNNLYVGRKGIVFVSDDSTPKYKYRYPPKDSIFANPFKISDEASRGSTLKNYKKYLVEKIEKGDITKEDLSTLKNKNIGCWCVTENEKEIVCHGQILLSVAAKYLKED